MVGVTLGLELLSGWSYSRVESLSGWKAEIRLQSMHLDVHYISDHVLNQTGLKENMSCHYF